MEARKNNADALHHIDVVNACAWCRAGGTSWGQGGHLEPGLGWGAKGSLASANPNFWSWYVEAKTFL